MHAREGAVSRVVAILRVIWDVLLPLAAGLVALWELLFHIHRPRPARRWAPVTDPARVAELRARLLRAAEVERNLRASHDAWAWVLVRQDTGATEHEASDVIAAIAADLGVKAGRPPSRLRLVARYVLAVGLIATGLANLAR